MSFVSPFSRYDYSSRLEILQFRDSQTGKVSLQIPSERIVDAYRRGTIISAKPLATHEAAPQPAAQQAPVPASRQAGAAEAGRPVGSVGEASAAKATDGAPAVAPAGVAATSTPAPEPVQAAPSPPSPAVAALAGIAVAAPVQAPAPAPAPVTEAKPVGGSGSVGAV